jgi:3-oxoacyl-[acyl-carrier protein] reductase
VTGGSRGIGRALVQRVLAERATVIAASRSGTSVPAADAPAAPDGIAEGIGCDVSNEASVASMVQHVVDTHSHLDILVNNAGIANAAMLHGMTAEAFRSVLDVNLTGTWLCTRAVIPFMRESGRGGAIVNISSVAGKVGNARQANYAASKAGVVRLTKVTARENAEFGIRANGLPRA